MNELYMEIFVKTPPSFWTKAHLMRRTVSRHFCRWDQNNRAQSFESHIRRKISHKKLGTLLFSEAICQCIRAYHYFCGCMCAVSHSLVHVAKEIKANKFRFIPFMRFTCASPYTRRFLVWFIRLFVRHHTFSPLELFFADSYSSDVIWNGNVRIWHDGNQGKTIPSIWHQN